MRQEDKEILIRDLCGRLSYGVKAYIKNWSNLSRKYYEGIYTVESIDPSLNTIIGYSERNFVEVIVDNDDYEIKPYLFPLSSMTDEEWEEYQKIRMIDCVHGDINGTFINPGLIVDWLNAHHFDYRGLIEKSLVLDATGLNIYKSIRNPFIKIIMSGNKENIKLDPITFESYGARMRNLLTPYQNLVCIIQDWLSGELNEDIVKKLLSNYDLQGGVDKLIEFSKSDKLEELNCRE